MTPEHPVDLGDRYQDRATGFQGVAVAVTYRWHGHTQVALERVGNDAKPVEHWFPEGRLQPAPDEPTGSYA